MKTVKIGIGLLAVAMAIMVQQLEGISNYQTIIAPFQAGYGYTQEEKDNAREEIALLEGQQAAMVQQYNEINARQDLSTQEKDEHVHSIVSSMYRLNEDIKELQLITGDAWSNDRKRAWGIVALITAGLVGYKFFGPSIIAFVTKDRKNSDKLIKTQKEQAQQLKELQQKQLDEKIAKEAKDQRNIEKAQRKAAEKKVKQEAEEKVKQEKANKKIEKTRKQLEDQKEVQRKVEEEAQKRAEYIIKENEHKERNKKYHINNQNIIDAQKQIAEINNAISNEKAQLNGEVGNQETNNKFAQLNEELEQAIQYLKNCRLEAELNDYKEKERVKNAEVAADYKQFLQDKEKEQKRKEDRIEMFKSALAETVRFVMNITAKLSVKTIKIGRDCFNYAKARSRLSKEDQEAIIRGLF